MQMLGKITQANHNDRNEMQKFFDGFVNRPYTIKKNESVNRSIDKNYPNWNTKKKKKKKSMGTGEVGRLAFKNRN